MTGGKTMPRPVLKYPGSKWRLAEWIISLMPEKKSYLEPFFGPVLIVGMANGEFVSLTEQQVEDLLEMGALRRDDP